MEGIASIIDPCRIMAENYPFEGCNNKFVMSSVQILHVTSSYSAA